MMMHTVPVDVFHDQSLFFSFPRKEKRTWFLFQSEDPLGGGQSAAIALPPGIPSQAVNDPPVSSLASAGDLDSPSTTKVRTSPPV